MRHLADDVELLDRDLVDLVQQVDARDVGPGQGEERGGEQSVKRSPWGNCEGGGDRSKRKFGGVNVKLQLV